ILAPSSDGVFPDLALEELCTMRNVGLLILALLLCCAAVRAGDDADAAKAIVAKAVKAAGLDKDADKLYAETWKDKGAINLMGQKLDYTANWTYQAPDKYRFELKMEIMGQKIDVIQATDGVKAFESVLGMQMDLE